MNILLINPWITDFAAYDFWIKPLGLLYTGAFLAGRGHSVRLIDCMDRFQDGRGFAVEGETRWYSTGKFRRESIEKPACLRHIPQQYSRYGIPAGLFRELALDGPAPDAVLVTCIMTYWYRGAFEAISIIRGLFPGVPIIMGGIYATLCTDHARRESGADAIVAESNPSRIVEIVESVAGKKGNGDGVPDHFSGWPEPLWNLYERLPSAVTMTSRGCPMRCTVCASHLLFGGFERKNPSDAAASIAKLAARGVSDVAFCDDALLIDAGRFALPFFEELAVRKPPIRLHTPNGLHVREITAELAALMKAAGIVTVRLSLETASRERARDFSGKATRDDFRSAVEALFSAGYTAADIGAYILVGLPGQTAGEVAETAEFVLESGVTVKPALFSPVPGTVEFDRAVEAGMIRRDDDPVLQNNSLRKFDLWGGDETGRYERFKQAVAGANRELVQSGTFRQGLFDGIR